MNMINEYLLSPHELSIHFHFALHIYFARYIIISLYAVVSLKIKSREMILFVKKMIIIGKQGGILNRKLYKVSHLSLQYYLT